MRVTPRANKRTTSSSAKSPSCWGPTGPVTTTSVTRSRQAPRRTVGSSASSGNVVTASTAVWTSSAARPMSQPASNSSLMDADPSRDSEDELSTPSTARRTGSKTCTMPASTSSAPAPSHTARTVTLSMITSGKNCARILGTATIPATSISSSNRLADVRWRTK